jgi:hypothetical protein
MHSPPLDTSLKSPLQYKFGLLHLQSLTNSIFQLLIIVELAAFQTFLWLNIHLCAVFFWLDALSCRSMRWQWISLQETCFAYKKWITLQTSSQDWVSSAIAHQLIPISNIWFTDWLTLVPCVACYSYYRCYLVPKQKQKENKIGD